MFGELNPFSKNKIQNYTIWYPKVFKVYLITEHQIMHRKIFLSGLLLLTISLFALGFPFSDKVSSMTETYSDCQKGTDDLRAAFLMARGVCEPAKVLYYAFLFASIIGFIVLIIGLIKKKPVIKNTY